MKRVINGKLYNTHTAILIAGADTAGLGKNDFRYYTEHLFKTKNGTFFLAGEGHGMTRWGSHKNGISGWGCGIKILTDNEALAWCEENAINPDTIAQHFLITEG